MISRSLGSKFSLLIYDSDVVLGRSRFQRHSRSVFRGWLRCLQGLSFRQWFVILTKSTGDEDFSVSGGSWFRWWFAGLQGLSFRQWFMILTSSMRAKDFSVNLDLGSGDDLWCFRDPFFVNDLWFWPSPRALKISASLWIWVSGMISESLGTQFSFMIYDSDVVHGRWRFQRHFRSGFQGWLRGLQGLSFCQWFVILT